VALTAEEPQRPPDRAQADGQSWPRRFEQRIFGHGGFRLLQQQSEQGHRALAEYDRLGTPEQDFRVRIEPERAEFVRLRHR